MSNENKDSFAICNVYFNVYAYSRFSLSTKKTSFNITYGTTISDKSMQKLTDAKAKFDHEVYEIKFNFLYTINKDKEFMVSINWADWVFNRVTINMTHQIDGIYIPGHIENINSCKTCKKLLNAIIKKIMNTDDQLDFTYNKSNKTLNIIDQKLYDVVENLNIRFRLK